MKTGRTSAYDSGNPMLLPARSGAKLRPTVGPPSEFEFEQEEE
jgi:hypothetical protein